MLFVHLPELAWRASPFRLEHAVEIGEIVEPAFIADLGYVPGGIDQHSGSESQPDIGNIIRQCTIGPDTEKAAECHRAHPGESGKVIESQLLGIMVIDILLYLLYPTAFLVA